VSALTSIVRGRRRAAPVALGLVALAAAGVAAATLLGGGESAGARKRSAGGSTARVERRTLVERETVDGTLGYAGHRTVINRLSASGGSDTPSGDSPTNKPAADTPASDSPTAVPASYTPAAYTPPSQDNPSEDDPSQDNPDQDNPNRDNPNRDNPNSDNTPNENDDSANKDDNSANDDNDSANQDDNSPNGSSPSADGSSPNGSSPSDSSDSSNSSDSYQGSGTLTAMARAGSVVKRGGALYWLDGDPIVLMYGSTPSYRTLKQGVGDGDDVRELEANLVALGFDPGTVDDTYTSSTAAAVSAWQKSIGLDQTGTVLLGRVVFLPGPRRIGEHKASLGTVLSSGAEVLDTSSTKRVVTIALDATKQSMAHEGAGVTVTLPDGSIVRGKISKVGTVAREEQGDQSDPNAQKQLVIDVTVALRSDKGIGHLDEAPVGVGLAQQARRHVLSVPVNALLARRGGGYGVELADSHRIVPVEAGLFADGYVEVSGRAVGEGTRVVVPSE
jgi:putative peptidoglycan binding protein